MIRDFPSALASGEIVGFQLNSVSETETFTQTTVVDGTPAPEGSIFPATPSRHSFGDGQRGTLEFMRWQMRVFNDVPGEAHEQEAAR